jgi:hypothetical protein
MIIWIHISELKSTVVIGDNTYAPSDDPKDCQPMPEELKAYLGIAAQPVGAPLADAAPVDSAPPAAKKG